jgi:pyridinium-3,5-biscarboxylic acid mononucleotide sulfurtransferase
MTVSTDANEQADALANVLRGWRRIAVAVSGGVDSMTLATFAHQRVDAEVEMFHAVSPAVPDSATARVRRHAEAQRWRLHLIDAGEFSDPDYLTNPVNRCFYCKTHLYGAIVARTDAVVVSGTNTDDLTDYRPGLRAADTHGVQHPYVSAGLDKAGVRAIARVLGLTDVAELPAAPCLASRVQTGIPIVARTLGVVDEIETAIRAAIAPEVVRCRVRTDRVVIELDESALNRISDTERVQVAAQAASVWESAGREPIPIEFAPYRRGDSFRHPNLVEPGRSR